jgi:hypothetical protein
MVAMPVSSTFFEIEIRAFDQSFLAGLAIAGPNPRQNSAKKSVLNKFARTKCAPPHWNQIIE